MTDRLLTVKFDAGGKVLKRHAHEDDVDPRDPKRVRFTHKQPDKRMDLEMTDGTVAKRAKVFDSHHPVDQATRLRRLCMTHLVKLETLRRVKTLRRKLELTRVWKSVPLRR